MRLFAFLRTRARSWLRRCLSSLPGLPRMPFAQGGKLPGHPANLGDDVLIRMSPGRAYCGDPDCPWEHVTNDEIEAIWKQAEHQRDTRGDTT